ncbi:Protein arginine N-methyltransferase 2 [Vulpes lagopus]
MGLRRTTHWRQVLFMMDEPVSMLSGDVVTGSVVLQRNPVWRRHMSVALSWSVTSTQDPTSQKEGGREGLSHLEVMVEVVGSRCCRNEPGRRRAWM